MDKPKSEWTIADYDRAIQACHERQREINRQRDAMYEDIPKVVGVTFFTLIIGVCLIFTAIAIWG